MQILLNKYRLGVASCENISVIFTGLIMYTALLRTCTNASVLVAWNLHMIFGFTRTVVVQLGEK
jgi:hypothetical protein